ncbi:hypothetical protein IFU37_012745 [Pantoea agglomerans]|uniref:hypothetical protein n=1 Tax=Enterobacter agglomerans TaxID=549 RepID=UPI00177E659C|nr:hypothetical protein [Pantoea agglomerans]WVL88501.1 hypothetical protein IFU37_012745 [Pantoea agglomerans]
MARVRKNAADTWMPPRVYRARSAFEFKAKNGGTIRLCNADSSPSQVWAAYEALINDRKREDLLEGLAEGILIKQSKTSVAQIKGWSDRLRSAIELSSQLPLNQGMSSIYIIHQPSGAGYTRDGFNSRWLKLKKEAKEKFPELDFDFTFHDLKAKGVSDLSVDIYKKREISGHKNVEQTARYDRKIAVVPVVGAELEGKNILKGYSEK